MREKLKITISPESLNSPAKDAISAVTFPGEEGRLPDAWEHPILYIKAFRQFILRDFPVLFVIQDRYQKKSRKGLEHRGQIVWGFMVLPNG